MPNEISENVQSPREFPLASSVVKRYRDAYLVARATNGYGSLIKFVGVALAVLFCIVGFLLSNRLGEFAIVVGAILGIAVGAGFYLSGILVSSQGQILKATLDNAVNSSPFLSDEHRASMMSLKASSAYSADTKTYSAETKTGKYGNCEVCGEPITWTDSLNSKIPKCRKHLYTNTSS